MILHIRRQAVQGVVKVHHETINYLLHVNQRCGRSNEMSMEFVTVMRLPAV